MTKTIGNQFSEVRLVAALAGSIVLLSGWLSVPPWRPRLEKLMSVWTKRW